MDDNDDDENTRKSLKQMIMDFQTLIKKKYASKDNVVSVKVNNVQVAALQCLMVLKPLVLKMGVSFWIFVDGRKFECG